MQAHQPRLFLLLMALLLVGLTLVSLRIGAVSIPTAAILEAFLGKNTDAVQVMVLWEIRLPRLLLTLLIGASLGLSGAVLQGLFRNPLVEPGIIGVSSGAALGAVLVLIGLGNLIGEARSWLLPLAAFVGGLLATFLTLRLSAHEGKTQITYLILAGVAINALAGAMIGLSIFYADDAQLRNYTFWTLGDLSVASWDKLYWLFPLIGLACLGLIRLGRPLNAIALGEAEAFHSGVAVERVKRWAVVGAALAVGTAVAFVGMIGFVGLVVPHIVRMVFGADHAWVLPAATLGGAILLVVADLIARVAVAPSELPIGVITAAIGTPFFVYLLIQSKNKGAI